MNQLTTYTLGDSAVTAEMGTEINRELNHKALAMRDWLVKHPFQGLLDVIQSYSSVTIYYDPIVVMKTYQPPVIYKWVEAKLQAAFNNAISFPEKTGSVHRIPVCYDQQWATDLETMSVTKNIPKEELIRLHTSVHYRVYMIGFMPGFAYMGSVEAQLVTARKAKPSLVAAGSVGIAGEQTGIYPLESPGGWNIIGRTPLTLFDPNSVTPTWLNAGDEVIFYPISREEFDGIEGGEGMS